MWNLWGLWACKIAKPTICIHRLHPAWWYFPFCPFCFEELAKADSAFFLLSMLAFSTPSFFLPTFAKSAHIDFFHPVLQWPLLHLKQRLNYWICVGSYFFPSHIHICTSLSLSFPYFLISLSLSSLHFSFTTIVSIYAYIRYLPQFPCLHTLVHSLILFSCKNSYFS